METFEFKLYIKTGENLPNGNNQEKVIFTKNINAKNYDNANKIFRELNLPTYDYATVGRITK
jgi:hypothetical protein